MQSMTVEFICLHFYYFVQEQKALDETSLLKSQWLQHHQRLTRHSLFGSKLTPALFEEQFHGMTSTTDGRVVFVKQFAVAEHKTRVDRKLLQRLVATKQLV